MNLRYVFLSVAVLLATATANCQIDRYSTIDLHPVSPTAYQFVKYTEMPVSQYTGVPNISIPLYNIKVDDITIPLDLTYHGGGIRTTEEASWVGLGWDLQMGGSIVQTINDVDDYVNEQNVPPYSPYTPIKRLPDFFPSNGDGSPWVLPMHNQPPTVGPGTGWVNPYPINNPEARQGYAICTDMYLPVNGDFDTKQVSLITSPYYDSEPDIFVANFLGTTIKFTVNFGTNANNSIVILNKGNNNSGYQVSKTTDGFKILDPSGNQFFFEVKSVIKNTSIGQSIEGVSGSLHTGGDIVSNIYFLDKIITYKGKLVTYDYAQTALVDGYPNISQKLQVMTSRNTVLAPTLGGNGGYLFTNNDNRTNTIYPGGGVFNTSSYNTEKYFYLSTIHFPTGQVNFQLSDRTDISGGKKLDKLQVLNTDNTVIKTIDLDYSYFDATSVSGNGYGSSTYDNLPASNLRLKLLDVKDGSGGTYNFIYNNTLLPKKNSYAQDYWGFYNGKLSNTDLVPNPGLFNISWLANNNDRSPNVNYAKAAILEGIQYPTGGKVTFDYELNEFDHGQFIGLNNTPQTMQGAGLRIHAVNHYTADNIPATKTQYTYEGGKLLNRLIIARDLNYSVLNRLDINGTETDYETFTEVSVNGVFSSNPLSSVNGVGYSKVTAIDADGSNIAKGKTVTEFYNTEDINNVSIYTRALNCNLPPIKATGVPENGSVKSVNIYNDQNKLLRSVVNTYSQYTSDIFYGARIMGYGALHYAWVIPGEFHEGFLAQNIIGYYPIYDVYTSLIKTISTEYDDNSNSLVTEKNYSYDYFNQLSYQQTRSSRDEYLEEYITHAYEYAQSTGDQSLVTAHRLSEITNLATKRRKSNYYQFTDQYKYDKTYTTAGSNVVVNQVTTNEHPGTGELPSVISYDKYDPINANLQQFTVKGTTNSLLWDYAGEYVTAEVANAAFSDVAATSFEADSKGNWTYTGTPIADAQALTGKKVYPMSGGAISKTGLDAGKNYTVSYWSNAGVLNVNSSAYKTGRSLNGYTYYEHKVPTPAGGNIAVTGSGQVDELRLYPEKSQMKTYTYTPLVGLASQCDENNKINYYTYDYANRLSIVRDQDKNIIKKICYNYAGQVEDCVTGSSSTAQWRPTGNSRCQACPQNSNYISDVKEKEERDINPLSPTYNTLHWVVDPLEHCVPPPAWQQRPDLAYCEQNSNGINTGNLVTPVYDINPCSSSYGQPGISIVSLSPGCSPASCSTLNCLEPEYKCINGVCTHGTWSIVRVSRSGLRDPVWTCIYAWCFPDGTTSTYTQTTTGSTACTVNCY